MCKIRKIPNREESDYPRVGIPLESVGLVNGNSLKTSFRGHIKLSEIEGIFLGDDFDTESNALENSAEVVVDMRKNGNIKQYTGKY